jgi:hypothetical protein
MNTSFRQAAGAAALTLLLHHPLAAQVSLQTTPPPTVTAENEVWYSSGAPVTFAGIVYYPAGPVTHFLRNEMVRTGTVGGVPVYARTTQESGSVIYVPLAGGVMKPYERRRAGDLAGTVGSSAPSFRVVLASEETQESVTSPAGVPFPAGTIGVLGDTTPDLAEFAAPSASGPVGTSGVGVDAPAAPMRTRLETAQRPVGLNTVFVDFQNTRWFAAGATVEFTPERFTRVGEHHGFDVYQENARPDTIYLSLLDGAPGLLAPYKRLVLPARRPPSLRWPTDWRTQPRKRD